MAFQVAWLLSNADAIVTAVNVRLARNIKDSHQNKACLEASENSTVYQHILPVHTLPLQASGKPRYAPAD